MGLLDVGLWHSRFPKLSSFFALNRPIRGKVSTFFSLRANCCLASSPRRCTTESDRASSTQTQLTQPT